MRLGRVLANSWKDYVTVYYPSICSCEVLKKIHQVKQVIDTSPETARARLLLFYCAKKVLAEGMIVLGIEPLDRVWLWPQIYISISWSTTFDDEGYLLSLQDIRYNFNSRVRLRGPFRSADVSKNCLFFDNCLDCLLHQSKLGYSSLIV